jgi:hypothetical protein
MPFTTAELDNIAVAALDYYLNRGESYKQTIQNKPLLAAMLAKKKKFPSGKENISVAVKGVYGAAGVNDTVRGFTHDDAVTFYNPTNNRRANYPWREHHIGMSLTHTELKIDGVSVVDTNGERTSNHTGREKTALINLLDDKLDDLGEQKARGLNKLLWGDGTTDAKAMAGIRAHIVANPLAGTSGGLSRVTYTWWRNRARTAAHGTAGGTGAITSNTAAGGALVQVLQEEQRQLIRYGGKPTAFFAGSDFIGAMEKEMRANGTYSQSGFRGTQDASMGGMQFGGYDVVYDPTMDDDGYAKWAYWFDPTKLFLMDMEGEWDRVHAPARPPTQFVLYRSVTATGQVVMTQANCHGVYQIT